jgi:hypothetical protein
MPPQTPQDRRAFESPDWAPSATDADIDQRPAVRDRTRDTGRAMLASFIVLLAIIALILLL